MYQFCCAGMQLLLLPVAGWLIFRRQLKQGLRAVSRDIRNRQERGVEEFLPSQSCSRGRAGALRIPYGSFLSRTPCAVSFLHTRGQKHVFQHAVSSQSARAKPYFSLSPSSTMQTPQSSHSHSMGHPAPAPSCMEHSSWPCSRGNHMQIKGFVLISR